MIDQREIEQKKRNMQKEIEKEREKMKLDIAIFGIKLIFFLLLFILVMYYLYSIN